MFYLSSYNYNKLSKLLIAASEGVRSAWRNAKAEKNYQYRFEADSSVRNEIDELLKMNLKSKKTQDYLNQFA